MTRLDDTNPRHPQGLHRLGDALARAAAQQYRPHHPHPIGPILRIVAAIGAAALLWGLWGVRLENTSAGAVEVTVEGTTVTVTIDSTATPDEVRAALRQATVEADVRAVPTGPSAVGRFVTLSSTGPTSWPTCTAGPCSATTIQFQTNATTTIGVGAPTPSGERYGQFTDAFAPGEPLEGTTGILGQRYQDVAATLNQAARAAHITLSVDPADADPARIVTSVLMTSATTAVVVVQ